MFNDIKFGRYIYKDSIFNSLHPLAKIIVTLILLIEILFNNIYSNLILLVILIIYILISKIN